MYEEFEAKDGGYYLSDVLRRLECACAELHAALDGPCNDVVEERPYARSLQERLSLLIQDFNACAVSVEGAVKAVCSLRELVSGPADKPLRGGQ